MECWPVLASLSRDFREVSDPFLGPFLIRLAKSFWFMITKSNLPILIRIFSYSILAITLVFLINNVLTVWFEWPGVKKLFSHYGFFGFKILSKPLEGSLLTAAYIQLFL